MVASRPAESLNTMACRDYRGSRQSLAIENVIADACRTRSLAFPRHPDGAAVIEKCTVGRIARWIDQQLRRDHLRGVPVTPIARPVALAVAPVGKLARRLLAALENDSARGCRKIPAAHPVEYRPADCRHAAAALAAGFPVQGQCQAMLLIFEAARPGVARKDQHREHESPGKKQTSM